MLFLPGQQPFEFLRETKKMSFLCRTANQFDSYYLTISFHFKRTSMNHKALETNKQQLTSFVNPLQP